MSSSSGTITSKLGFIGAGQMAQALSRSLVRVCQSAQQISLSDRGHQAPGFKDLAELGFRYLPQDNLGVVKSSDWIFICVKPNCVQDVMQEISAQLSPGRHVIVSIAAGISHENIQSWYRGSDRLKIIQLMPNTPCMVEQGAGCFITSSEVNEKEVAEFRALLRGSMPVLEQIHSQSQMDAVVGLSGSGPAYVFMMAEALADGAVKMGLPRELAQKLAIQTLKGSASLMQQTGEHPAVLKDRVCSPGGTTAHGVHQLELGGLRASLINAVEAATKRSASLGGRQ